MTQVNCGYRNHDFKPTGRKEAEFSFYGHGVTILTEFECTKCGISTSWEE